MSVLRFFCFLLFVAIIGNGSAVQAQVLVENSRINFGKVVLADNSTQVDLQLNANCGGFTADPKYLHHINPTCGSYTVSGYAPFQVVNVAVTTATLAPVGGTGPSFTTVNTFSFPATPITMDAGGGLTFQVGATMRSSGSGVTYADDAFNGGYNVTVTP